MLSALVAVLAALATSGATGPRPLPPTFVPLELAAFPRPAAEACADNTRIVHARPPDGIARAFAHVQPGTTVLADPGTYAAGEGESVALDWSTKNVCLRPAASGAVVLAASAGQSYGITISAGDSVIEGLTLRGFRSSIALDAGPGKTLARVTLERVTVSAGGDGFRDGVASYEDNRSVAGRPPAVDGLLVLDSRIGGADLGLSCDAGPCAHWWVEGSTVADRRTSEDSGADAFAVESGRQIAVVDSTFRGAAADGIDTKADGVVVFGARVVGVARNGIKLWHGGDVIDSVVDGSGADASLVGDAAGRYRYLHVLVFHHAPSGTGYVGTWGYDHQSENFRLEIVNSLFAQDASGGFFAPASTRLSVRHTLFDDPRDKLFDLSDGRSWQVSDLAAFEAAGFGSANVVGAPRLVTSGPGRWSTAAGSPARDVAERVSGLTRDLYGSDRVQGAGPDIGPVEAAG